LVPVSSALDVRSTGDSAPRKSRSLEIDMH
jgi:hypothetical protein